MLAVWQAADDIDVFESGWTFDHFYPIFSDSAGPCLEGWTTLTALAQATRRLRLGTLVTGIHYRHPAVLANMAAALDVISDGRLELGIGAGWNEEESGAYGIELGSIRERFDRFEEACQVLIGLLSEETFNFDGKYYQLKDARNEPKGPQRPHPPICIGGSGEKRTLPLTARYAQHWNFAGGTLRSSRASATCWRRAARTSGATRRKSPCRRMCGSARTSTTDRSSKPPPGWRPRDSTWESSTYHRRTTRPSWNRWPRRSGIRGCCRRSDDSVPPSKLAVESRLDSLGCYVPNNNSSWAVTRRSCLAGNSRLFTG